MKLSIRPSTLEDVNFLSTRLREADREDVLAAGSESPEASLLAGFRMSDECSTVTDSEGTPIFMFGVIPLETDPSVGCIWLLSSDEIEKHQVEFLRRCRPFVDHLMKNYRVIGNFTDCRNKLHHRWLRWCGFKFYGTVQGRGPGSLPFYDFARTRDEHV